MADAQSVTDDADPALITIDITDVNEVLEAFYAWLADLELTAEPSDDSDSGISASSCLLAIQPIPRSSASNSCLARWNSSARVNHNAAPGVKWGGRAPQERRHSKPRRVRHHAMP